MTNVYAPELYPRRKCWPHPRHELHIKSNPTVDPALIAADLDISEGYVRMIKRKLGLNNLND